MTKLSDPVLDVLSLDREWQDVNWRNIPADVVWEAGLVARGALSHVRRPTNREYEELGIRKPAVSKQGVKSVQ